MKFNSIKRNNGITLIALVITIIVLLILAGVSIATLGGQEGILSKAQNAVSQTNQRDLKEQVDLAIMGTKIQEDYQYKKDNAKTEIEKIAGVTVTDNGDGTLTVTKDKTTVNVDKDGNTTIVGETDTNSLVALFDSGELQVGDYVDYKNPTSGPVTSNQTGNGYADQTGNGYADQTFSIESNTTYWRVLRKEGEGSNAHIVLIGSPIRTIDDKNFYLKGAKGYINAETELDKICAMYKNEYADSARSVNIDDINKAVGVTVTSTGLNPNVDEHGNFGQTFECIDASQYESPEDFLSGTKSNFTKKSDAYYYKGNNSQLESATNTRLYNMLFGNTDAKSYWLASRSVFVGSDCAYFGAGLVDYGDAYSGDCYLFESSGYNEISNSCSVRPVVNLKSNVTKTQVPKMTTDPTEETW